MDVPSAPATPGTRGADLIARFDRLPRMTRPHWRWLPLLGLLSFGDTTDNSVLAYAAPAMRRDWGLSISQIGNLTSLSLLGSFVGALVGGRLADRFGRKRIIIAGTLLYSVSSILCGLAPNLGVLGLFRVLSGLGIQAVIGVLSVYVAEMYPTRVRGRSQAAVLGVGLLGVPFAAVTAKLIIPLDPQAWRWVFVVGAVGLVPAILGMFLLPESVRWLIAGGRDERASRIVSGLEARYSGELPPPVLTAPSAPPARGKTAELFTGSQRRITIVTALTLVFGIVAFYGFNSWVPTLLAERGHSTDTALTITTILSIAPPFGALAGMLVTDRWERRHVLAATSLTIALLMAVFAFTDALWPTIVVGFLITMFLQSNAVTIYAYLPEVFPTTLRGFGAGLSNGAGRLAGVGGAALVAAIYGVAGFVGVFLTTALFSLATAVVIGLFGENTRNRSLR
ncbi:putative MFS transporter [Amycolatopsis bartoniae]|uniref:Putative metabolite transport protein YyaJ n=1 Tax=Amycolatopsis bartoniae TaxID=941986 RepID=A0A8H9IM21_9PSEU|nr:MFS transporter [Amycolatopsis bartoniae]MBB2940015.1 putative MFS transporter [Amycolatopsis bartoniae]TVT09981.1 MFS transporter [Amycolatopsis bartoniae]GHF31998.1 putative metabolite transport protein YyaJ [Amycolatopsis bartoniae]